MSIVFIDSGTIIISVIVLSSIIANTAMSAAEWVVKHILIVLVLLFIKSALEIRSLKKETRKEWSAFGSAMLVPIDMLRAGLGIFILTDGILSIFSGSISHFLGCIFGLIITAPCDMLFSFTPMILDNNEEAELKFVYTMELLSLSVLGLLTFMIYIWAGGW